MENDTSLANRRSIRMTGKVESELRERLSERELEYLELKARMIKENKALRDELSQREQELIEREAAVRRLNMKLHQERSEMASSKAQYDLQVTNLQRKIQNAVGEISKLHVEVQRNSKKTGKNEEVLRQQLGKRESQILQYQREIELLQSQLEVANEKLETSSKSQAQLHQSNQTYSSRVADLSARVQVLESQVEKARLRDVENEARLEKLREERERAEDQAARARMASEKAQAALDKERLHFAALQDEYQLLQQQPSLKENRQQQPQPSAKQVMELKTELRRCIGQLKDWRKRVEDVDKKNRSLKSQLNEALCKLAAQEKLSYPSSSQLNGEQQSHPSSSHQQLNDEKERHSSSSSPTQQQLESESRWAELESRRAEAEWERVELEKRNMQLEEQVEDLKQAINSQQGKLDAFQAHLKEQGDRQREADDDNQVLLEKIAEAEVRIEQLQAELESKENAQETHVLRDLLSSVQILLDAVFHLSGLLEAYLSGEQPSMEMLLDEVEVSLRDPPEPSKGSMENLGARVARCRDTVNDLRSRIADNYAKNLGNDCQVQ